jgi:hypothetical protein
VSLVTNKILYLALPYIYMIHVPRPQLSEHFLAPIKQVGIIPTANISRAHFIANDYPPSHDRTVRWKKGENE